jgi:hypothetical protein
MGGKKDRQQIIKGDLAGIEIYFDCFGMPCLPTANFFIGGLFCTPAGVPRHDRNYSPQFIEDRLCTPKTAAAKTRDLSIFSLSHLAPNSWIDLTLERAIEDPGR